jgi:hypothetical protein
VKDSEPATGDPNPEGVVALARRASDRAVARELTVGLRPEEVIETLVGLDRIEPRNPREENRLEVRYHQGTYFFERTSDGLVLCLPAMSALAFSSASPAGTATWGSTPLPSQLVLVMGFTPRPTGTMTRK